MNVYIYYHHDWPHFTWNNEQILLLLGEVRNRQGNILGRMESLGFGLKKEAEFETLTLDVLESTEIEGEPLNSEQVRSSLARRLGIQIAGLVASERNVDGMVDMMIDATRNFEKPMTGMVCDPSSFR